VKTDSNERSTPGLHRPARRGPAQLSGWVGALGDHGNTNSDELAIGLGLAEPDGVTVVSFVGGHVVYALAVPNPEPVIPRGLGNQQSSHDERQSTIQAACRAELCVARPRRRMLIEGSSSEHRDGRRINASRPLTGGPPRVRTSHLRAVAGHWNCPVLCPQLRDPLLGGLRRCLAGVRSTPLTVQGRVSRCRHRTQTLRVASPPAPRARTTIPNDGCSRRPTAPERHLGMCQTPTGAVRQRKAQGAQRFIGPAVCVCSLVP
jgi:hypothetical protein